MNNKHILFILILALSFQSCKSKKRIVSTKSKTKTERVIIGRKSDKVVKKEVRTETKISPPPKNATYAEVVLNYIDNYKAIAKEEMLQYGIPASITLAQGILESGAGRGTLTKKANNHFGIKCHSSWTGERVYHDDDEKGECFRKYRDPRYSFRDHSLFLSQRTRYQGLFTLKKRDYRGWAKGLKKAGYATDPKYPAKLINIIERYDLTQYDNEVLGGKVKITKLDETKISTYTVQKGETLYSISRRFSMTVDTLKEYNGLNSNAISVGQVLYLHPAKGR
ncbi:MAG: glucosaminidase domain-containing protein [Flavobacteriaceae bacterium]|nr:glucosaminidase domain-containing protein [Flavobacteriaceae bacterium]